jgi:glutamyl-Q tRNA(Asp) synthetase
MQIADPMRMPYRGRFAPTPSGPLHRGSLVAALASWLDSRAHGGDWLVRIEDIDPPRQSREAALDQVRTLASLGFLPDGPVLRQGDRHAAYAAAIDLLARQGRVYGCSCTRALLAAKGTDGAPGRYPGRCRGTPPGAPQASIRFQVEPGTESFRDRASGLFRQDVLAEVGDFILRRSDGLWAYQLAVVVDDAWQGVTDVVRGEDLLDNTPRQIALQHALGLPTPRYLHVPLVTDLSGRKLSKSEGAGAIDRTRPLAELEQAFAHLGFPSTGASDLPGFQRRAVAAWAERWP